MLPFMECSFIEMEFNSQKHIIGGIYRIPDTRINLFIDHFNRIVEPLKSTYKIILLGEYNINFLKNDTYRNTFEICLQSNFLLPTILSPTRIATKLRNGEK